MPDYTVPAMEATLSEARLTFETNFFSVICMCKTFLPLLIKAKGTIVQIGSVAGVGVVGLSYSSSEYIKAYGFFLLDYPLCFRIRLQCLKGRSAFME